MTELWVQDSVPHRACTRRQNVIFEYRLFRGLLFDFAIFDHQLRTMIFDEWKRSSKNVSEQSSLGFYEVRLPEIYPAPLKTNHAFSLRISPITKVALFAGGESSTCPPQICTAKLQGTVVWAWVPFFYQPIYIFLTHVQENDGRPSLGPAADGCCARHPGQSAPPHTALGCLPYRCPGGAPFHTRTQKERINQFISTIRSFFLN